MNSDIIGKYISEIEKKAKKLEDRTGLSFFCYRGEQQCFKTSAMPNIFRGENYIRLIENKYFEKNILDELRTNNLSSNNSLLLTAIDAQHGGFPSRLLDITFNSLIALFFAVTPHYNERLNKYDKKDGKIIIFGVNNLYSTADPSLQKYFEDITHGKMQEKQYCYNHKFIDYTMTNPRIISQNGGFILFSGNEYIPVSKWIQESVVVKNNEKKEIRNLLKKLFGLTMSSVYPEPTNYVDFLIEKTKFQNKISDSQNIILNVKNSLYYFENKLRDLQEVAVLNGDYSKYQKEISKILLGFEELLEELNLIFNGQENYKHVIKEAIDNSCKKMDFFLTTINSLNNKNKEEFNYERSDIK